MSSLKEKSKSYKGVNINKKGKIPLNIGKHIAKAEDQPLKKVSI